jgi:hypothetical protein
MQHQTPQNHRQKFLKINLQVFLKINLQVN